MRIAEREPDEESPDQEPGDGTDEQELPRSDAVGPRRPRMNERRFSSLAGDDEGDTKTD